MALVSSTTAFVAPDLLAGAAGIFVSHASSTLTTVDAQQLFSFTRRYSGSAPRVSRFLRWCRRMTDKRWTAIDAT